MNWRKFIALFGHVVVALLLALRDRQTGTAIMRSLILIVVTLLVDLHPSPVST